jgi:hypothetical protein
MIFEILKIGFLLAIAIPFLFMIYEVVVDVLQRLLGFYYKMRARPAVIDTRNTQRKF